MQTWAKRGIQTALVTGGLLMLGTGIASADENVNPDTPAGPLDLTVSVPVDISHNALGLPGRQVDLPAVHREISTKPVTDNVNKALAPVSRTGALKPAAPAIKTVNGATGSLSQAGKSLGRTEAARQTATPSAGAFDGNKVVGNVAAPIQITGNAIGLLGPATVQSDDTQTYQHGQDITTDGSNGGLAGNVVNLDWALPIQIAGNALGLGGAGHTSGSASQSATTNGNITTDGTNGGLAGNVIAPQGATPVQLSGNAIGGLAGHADSAFTGTSDSTSGGWIKSHGSQGSASGNVAGVPVALPVKLSNNGVSGLGGDADASGGATSDATAGDTTMGPYNRPSYIQTDGDQAALSGNIAQPQPAVPATVVGNAAAGLVGNSIAGSGFDRQTTIIGTNATSGGSSQTSGTNGAASGNIADAPVALPAEIFCVGGAVIGNAGAGGCDNVVDATAGGGTFTNGDGSLGGGNTVSPQPAGTAEVFGAGLSAIGNAAGSATEQKTVQAGGYNGSLGNNSTGAGNVVQVPTALPAEVLGVGGSVIGTGTGTADEVKTVTAGGGGNTQDDHGNASANLVSAPLSVPLQAFGLGGAVAGLGQGTASTDTTSTAGGHVNTNGKQGFVAGNLGFLPVSLPTQAHGVGGALLGSAFGQSDNTTDSTAGGDATATGQGGSIAGNIVQLPTGGTAGVFGVGGVLGGVTGGDANNNVTSTAGGTAQTNGDGGSIAGDVISGQLLPVAQVFGDAISGAGVTHGSAINNTTATNGGDITTSGVGGALAGDIFDAPVTAVAQVFGVAASLGGVAHAVADNTTTTTNGGTDTSAGNVQSGSGVVRQLPVGALVQVFDVPMGLVSTVSSTTSNVTNVDNAGHKPQIDLPITHPSALTATSLPSLPALPKSDTQRADLPSLPGADALSGALPGAGAVTGALSGAQTLPVSMSGNLPTGQLPVASNLTSAGPQALAGQITGALSGKGLHIQG